MTNLNDTCTGARHCVNMTDDTGCELLPVELSDRTEWRGVDSDPKIGSTSCSLANIDYLLSTILSMYRMKHRLKTQNEQKHAYQKLAESEWRRVALVMDRFFFYLYIAIFIVSLILLFPRKAYWYYWQFSRNDLWFHTCGFILDGKYLMTRWKLQSCISIT